MGARKTRDINYDGSKPLEDSKAELFCEIYTTNSLPKFWGNGTQSYAFAYGHTARINEINRKINGTAKDRKRKSKATLLREIVSIENGCLASSSRLLVNANIKKRCAYLLDQLASNLIVDRELTYIIQQRRDLDVKVRAIEHHDKREQRIREKVDIKHEFDPITAVEFVVAGRQKKSA